jgi:hypothetical protein
MELRLNRFRNQSERAFLRELEKATSELCASLPMGARNWGSARKFLNIFLRGCSYNKYLSAHYGFDEIESWLEVPLDSHVAKGLKKIAGSRNLPRWDGVIHLAREESAMFQDFATEAARDDGVNRVDLDVKFWRRVD